MARPDFSPFAGLLLDTLTKKDLAYGYNGLSRDSILKRLGEKMGRLPRGSDDERLDTWLDIAGYAAIGWLLERGEYYPAGDKERIYLACPIDAASGQVPEGYDELIDGLNRLQIEYYVPIMAWSNARGSDVTKQVNELALKHSTIVIALWDTSHTPSVGTAFEIQQAHGLGITTWLVPGSASAYLRPYVSKAFNGVKEVLDELRKQRTIGGI